jgi:LemA protein
MTITEISAAVVAVVAGLGAVMTYNRLVRLKEDATAGQKNIDVELDRRAKLLDSLAAAARRYLSHENDTFTKIAELRAGAAKARAAGDESSRVQLETSLSSMLPQLQLTVEAYPELKGDETIARLMEEVVTTENRLGFAKSFYNGAAREFNEAHKQFPAVLYVSVLFRQFSQDLPYWEVDAATRAGLEASRLTL